MIYLTSDDLAADAYQVFIDESKGADDAVIDALEKKAVALVTTYMTGRYDTDKIFSENDPVRNELLAEIISRIVLYNLFRRNAARKVPSDTKENYEWAIKQLEMINSGRTRLEDLPKPVDNSGNPTGKTMFGNNSNPDFYI